MNMSEYQDLASRTAPSGNQRSKALNMSMGLAGEAGETVDYLKKVIFHGHELDRENLAKELGDVLWYVSQLADTFLIDLDYVAKMNIEKLRKRYPEGFKESDSINRVE